MQTNKFIIGVLAMFFGGIVIVNAQTDAVLATPSDTIQHEQEEDGEVDNRPKSRKNIAEGEYVKSVEIYRKDKRYHAIGDGFTGKWNDHLFVEAGAGLVKLLHQAGSTTFNPMTSAQIAVGKQFDKMNSARLSLYGAYGYMDNKNNLMYRYGGRVDYLFNISSYFYGYNPARPVEVSTIVGFGAMQTKMRSLGFSKMSLNMRLGLQCRFFTSPHGYFAFEPYYEMMTKDSYPSKQTNYNRIDMAFGASLSYIYYINNNFGDDTRKRYVDTLSNRGYTKFTEDSIPHLWRRPWFVEFSNGLNFAESPVYSGFQTLGNEVAVSVGKWLSPALALRATIMSRSGQWNNYVTPASDSPYHPAYERVYNSLYAGFRIDAMFNPFGLSKTFDWDDQFGAYLVAGGEMGRLIKYQHGQHLNSRSEAYTVGAHLWTKLSDGLQLFVEPRYTYYVYRIPYRNVDWMARFGDSGYGVNVGLTVTSCSPKFRNKNVILEEENSGKGILSNMEFGIGGGTNLTQTAGHYAGKSKVGFGGQVFAAYKLNSLMGVRLGFEYTRVGGSGLASYYDLNMSQESDGYAPVVRRGMWNYNHGVGMVSLAYQMNLVNVLAGYNPKRLFDLDAYVGPMLAFGMTTDASLAASEELKQGHEARLSEKALLPMTFGVNAGLKLTANVNNHIGVYFSPNINLLTGKRLAGVDMLRIRYIETLNLGVQYKF